MSDVKRTFCHNEDQSTSAGDPTSPTRKQDFGQGRIPDILECLANLSNDEVFTPPAIASAMLDLLPEHVWSDPNLKWLDIGCKTGVFLREAAKRLMVGLEEAIPSERDRINHILGEMLYGIATSHLTGLVARRTLYSATEANSDGSSARYIADFGVDGNIRFQPAEHTYGSGTSCTVCGANKTIDRPGMENYAYEIIHTDNPQELFTDKKGNPVKFDVIIGNPPYQMGDSSDSASAKPLYNKFVEVAKQLNPQYMTLIIPARWYARGKGLDQFRADMIADRDIVEIVDYPNEKEVFPDVEGIPGGVMYFLRAEGHQGDCGWITVSGGESSPRRELDLRSGGKVIYRNEFAYSISDKVRAVNADGDWMASDDKKVEREVKRSKPFGLRTYVTGKKKRGGGDIVLHQSDPSALSKTTWIQREKITKNDSWVGMHKVLVSRANGGALLSGAIISEPFHADKGSACTETFLIAGLFSTKSEADRRIAYMKTKFFRYLVSLRKLTQDNPPSVFSCVPAMDNSVVWTDAALYEHFGLTQEEIDHIEATIKDMP